MMTNVLANLPALLCLLLGALLIMVEVFLPGFGLPGITGLVLLGVGTVFVSMEFGMATAAAVLLVIIAVLAVLVSFVMHAASKGKMHHSELFLNDKEELHTRQDLQAFIGRTGVTKSVLRPAGIGDFDGIRLNVVTEGSYIERDKPIEIVGVDGTRIVVRERV